jgi:thiamine transport system substrate-binding protein
MRGKLAVFVILGVSLVFGLLFGRQAYLSKGIPREQFQTRKLRVLAYSTFLGSSGPGAEIAASFKSECACDVELVSGGDAGLLLQRLKIADAGVPFDIVLGLDQLMLEEAGRSFEWKRVFFGTAGRPEAVAAIKNPNFVAFDWSPMSFIFRKSQAGPVPQKLSDLTKPEFKKQFALQDPRSSSPGLQFFHWVKAVMGPNTSEFLTQFKGNVNSISPSWTFSYGLFKKEQTRFVFSYLTSLAFHWGYENDRDYQILRFEEGHPVQVEFVGIPATCRECELAEKFIGHMLKPESQKLIMEKNFMLPVIQGLEEGSIFATLPRLKTLNTESGKDLREWDEAFKR